MSDLDNLTNNGYVGVVVRSKDGKYLLLQRRMNPYNQFWSVPSVKRKLLESADDAACRAYHCDTMLIIEQKQDLKYINKTMHEGGYYYTYLLQVQRPYRVFSLGVKYQNFEWFDADKLPQNVTPEVLSAIATVEKWNN